MVPFCPSQAWLGNKFKRDWGLDCLNQPGSKRRSLLLLHKVSELWSLTDSVTGIQSDWISRIWTGTRAQNLWIRVSLRKVEKLTMTRCLKGLDSVDPIWMFEGDDWSYIAGVKNRIRTKLSILWTRSESIVKLQKSALLNVQRADLL